MRFKKMIAAGMSAVMLSVLCLAGCADETLNEVQVVDSGVQEQVNLTFFGNKADESNIHVIEKIMREFMAEHPNIVITYESIKGNAYYDTLNKRMESDCGDDIFMVNHDTMLTLHERGQAADLSGLSTIDSYTDGEKQQFEDSDGIFWVPTTVSAFGLYCNMDMLKEYGQDVPTNLHEFEEVCDFFLDKGITPVIADNDISLKTVAIGASYYSDYQQGTEKQLFDRINAGKTGLGDSLSDGLEIVDEIIKRGYVDAPATLDTEKTSEDLEYFAKGENPFMLTGVWASNRLKTDFGAAFKYEVHPMPILPDGSLIVVNPDTRLAVNAGSEHVEEAKMFVEYFTQAENLHEFCEDQCSISPLKDGQSSSAEEVQPIVQCFRDGAIVVGADAELELPIWGLTMDASRELLQGKSLQEVRQELNDESQKYIEAAEGAEG